MSEFKVTCDVCGSPLVLLHTGAAVCSKPIHVGGEMHGTMIMPEPDHARAIRLAWKLNTRPVAVPSKFMRAIGGDKPYYTTIVYFIEGEAQLWRRTGDKKAEGAVDVVCDGRGMTLVPWQAAIDEWAGLAGVGCGDDCCQPAADEVSPKVDTATPEDANLKADPFDGKPTPQEPALCASRDF